MDDSISIVIPTKNRTNSLKAVLNSYLRQKIVKEILIIDNSDGIDTEQYINNISKKEKKIRYIRSLTSCGLPGLRNAGIKSSTGRYIFFGEDDVELENNHLLILFDHLKKNKAHIIVGKIILILPGESKESAINRANRLMVDPLDKKLLLMHCSTEIKDDKQLPFSHAIMLIDKVVFEKVMYDENYKVNFWREETDFQLNAAKNGFKLIYCPHTTCYHIKRTNTGGCHSSSKLIYEFWALKNNIYFINKNRQYCKEQFNIRPISYLIRFIAFRIILNLKGIIIRIKYMNPTMKKNLKQAK